MQTYNKTQVSFSIFTDLLTFTEEQEEKVKSTNILGNRGKTILGTFLRRCIVFREIYSHICQYGLKLINVLILNLLRYKFPFSPFQSSSQSILNYVPK